MTWIAVAMNVGNVLVVLLSTVLMDRAGRRPLLLTSIGGMLCSVGLLTVALVQGVVVGVCVGVVLFVISFGLGLGPVCPPPLSPARPILRAHCPLSPLARAPHPSCTLRTFPAFGTMVAILGRALTLQRMAWMAGGVAAAR